MNITEKKLQGKINPHHLSASNFERQHQPKGNHSRFFALEYPFTFISREKWLYTAKYAITHASQSVACHY